MRVTKRDGKLEDVSFDKVLRRIKFFVEDLQTVDPTMVAQKVCSRIYDKVPTSELDEFAARVCQSMMTQSLEYGVLGSRIIVSNNHKNTPKKFSEAVDVLNSRDIYDKDVVAFVHEHKDALDAAINDKQDYEFDYFAFKTLERSYLLRVDKKVIERIQYLVMRVSLGLHYPELDEVIRCYSGMSQKYFTHATPTLFNAGTRRPQLLSCFLTAPDDSIAGIYKWISNLALISKEAGGIGGSVSCIRSKGAFIKGTNSYSRGTIPMLKVVNETMRYVNQGGRRAGSAAIYKEPHHPDIMGFLDLRKNHGNEDDRARDLFMGMWNSDLFMERVEKNQPWSLFDPDACPNLDKVWGDEYKALYTKYENEGKASRIIMARDLWKAICESQAETGVPYVLNKDAANRKSNHQHYGTIRGSNLCAEILEYHDEKEYACCCLASICLPKFVDAEMKTYNFDKLAEVAGQLVRNLNQVIDRNMYPVPETKVSNMLHRPLGIGVQGLADVFCLMRMPFDSEEAAELNKEIFAAIYYGAMKASIELAKRDGPYETFKGSPLSKGKFQFDLWNVEPSSRWNWQELREEVMLHGARNSLLTACMPTASTAQIMGNNEAIEPYTSNLYVRGTLSGNFVVVNNHLVKDLHDIDMWSTQMKDQIIAHNGSIQHIPGIPDTLKKLYKTAWELKQKVLMDMSAGRGPYICQTQSLNLFFEEPTVSKLSSASFYAWKMGLKTGSYYIRSRPKSQAQQFTIDPALASKVKAMEKKRNSPEPTEERRLGQMKTITTADGKKVEVICNDEICTVCSG